MFEVEMLPVNTKSNKPLICDVTTTYPVKTLQGIKQFMDGGKLPTGLAEETGGFKILATGDHWTVAQVVKAIKAHEIALACGLNFMPINNSMKLAHLYVSSKINKSIIVVNAFTFKAVSVTHPDIVALLSRMKGSCYPEAYLDDLFEILMLRGDGCYRFEDAIILNRETPHAMFAVNPLYNMCLDLEAVYYIDKSFHDGTSIMDITDSRTVDKNVNVKRLSKLYLSTTKTKSNYLILSTNKGKHLLYVSADFRYMVDAKTFVKVPIRSVQLRKLLQSYVDESYRLTEEQAKVLLEVGLNYVKATAK